MTEYSAFLKHLGIDKKQMLASMMSKIPESEKPSERGRKMTKEYEQRARIIQQAMKSCHSNNPIDCIEWFADRIIELEAQIEKLIDFVLSKTECCDVCPITDTCINSEGTCPYAEILAKGEEEVTREWLMQFISKEIKEK